MKISVWICLFTLGSILRVEAAWLLTRPDTTHPQQTMRRPIRAILPGYSLDTRSGYLAKPDSAIYRVVPGWLLAEVSGRPLYVIDGQTAKPDQLKNLKAISAASVQVIDAKRAVTLYGVIAREGIVAITTKAAVRSMKE